MTTPEPPQPRRLSRPRWFDIRIIGGVLLLVVSVAVGAKVLGSASKTTPVWAVAHSVSAGSVLVPGDLTAVDVNLGDQGRFYVDASSSLAGSVVNRSLQAGELLPAAALDALGDGRIVSVPVAPERMAPGVQHGSVVDVYLTVGRTAVAGDEVQTQLLQRGVTVQSLTAPASGGLSGAISHRYQVALLLAPSDADALIKQLPLGEAMIVLHTAASGPAAAGG